MKPIEEGCLAMIIKSNAGNRGTVTVGKYLGKVSGYKGCRRWEVNKPMSTEIFGVKRADIVFHLEEIQLIRIDDSDFKEESKSVNEVTNMEFNRSGAELIQENMAKKPKDYFEQPESYKILKKAQDAFEKRQLQRQLDKEFDIEEIDDEGL